MLRIILIILIVVLIAGQFFQPKANTGVRTGPQDITHAVSVPADVMNVLQRACYDCHSDSTQYWWYDKVFPINLWVADHIKDGKKGLNFTVFATYTDKKKNKKMEEIAEQVQEGEMPLQSYTIMHKQAKLSDAEKTLIVNWAKSNGGVSGEQEEQH